MIPSFLKKLSYSELECKIYIYMINEAFDELPKWIQKSEELLTDIETLPCKRKKEALLKAASIIMGDDILNITEDKIESGAWLRGRT